MNGPDAHDLTGESSTPDRKDTTKGTAVKDTISTGHESARMGMEVHLSYNTPDFSLV